MTAWKNGNANMLAVRVKRKLWHTSGAVSSTGGGKAAKKKKKVVLALHMKL